MNNAQNGGMQFTGPRFPVSPRADSHQSKWSSAPSLFTLVIVLAIVFLSVFPWVEWRHVPSPPWSFLSDSWPRYWTLRDLLSNIVAYVPLGFFLAILCSRPVDQLSNSKRIVADLVVAIGLASLLSFSLECLQTYLPNRIPSKLDWLANTGGACLGAITAVMGTQWLRHRMDAGLGVTTPLMIQSLSFLSPGRLSLGLLTLGLWVVIQAAPQRILFAGGEYAELFSFEIPTLALVSSGSLEVFIVAAQMCVISVLVWTATFNALARRLLLIGAFGAAFAVKSLSSTWLVSEANLLWWLTPGAQAGVLIGAICCALIITLPLRTQKKLAQFLVVAVTILINLAPDNPYYDTMIVYWDQGPWSSLHGLVQAFSYLWPMLALVYFWLALLAYNRRSIS